MGKPTKTEIADLVVISDTHCGCKLGLCPNEPIPVDDGGSYISSRLQKDVWAMWEEFWGEHVPFLTGGRPYAVVMNGDCLDGTHHGSTTPISHNIQDQKDIALAVLKPVVEACEGRYYHIRGTEAHVGPSAVNEEGVAKELGAIPMIEDLTDKKQYARWELWMDLAGALGHFTHHIGTTGSSAYESTAVYKELVESFIEAGRWGHRFPDFIGRAHRHRNFAIKVPTHRTHAWVFVTPAWQGRTPFIYKLAARQSQPQFGGVVVSVKNKIVTVKEKIWSLRRSRVVKL